MVDTRNRDRMRRIGIVIWMAFLTCIFLFICQRHLNATVIHVPQVNVSLNSSISNVTEGIIIPLYFYPNQEWAKLENYTPGLYAVIINPDSGPGTNFDPVYNKWINDLRSSGIEVLGYVPTFFNDGTLTLNEDEGYINDYYKWYNVSGIFLDQVASNCNESNIKFYGTLYNYIKGNQIAGNMVFMDPGVGVGQCYRNISDIINIFENNYSVFVKENMTYVKTSSYNPNHLSMIVYDVPNSTNMKHVINISRNLGIGYVFITNRSGSNPFDSLPEYIKNETDSVNPIRVSLYKQESDNNGNLTITLKFKATGGNGGYSFLFGRLPAFCDVFNESQIECTSKEAGNFTILMKVNDSLGFERDFYYSVNMTEAKIKNTYWTTYDTGYVLFLIIMIIVISYFVRFRIKHK